MNASSLIIRCFAEDKGGYWLAFCLDFDLAVQAGSFDEVCKKLDEQIHDYLYDALQGEDKAHAMHLLNRKAPLHLWVKFYLYLAISRLKNQFSQTHRPFCNTLPLSVS